MDFLSPLPPPTGSSHRLARNEILGGAAVIHSQRAPAHCPGTETGRSSRTAVSAPSPAGLISKWLSENATACA